MSPSHTLPHRPRTSFAFEFASARERATWVYGMLREIIDVPDFPPHRAVVAAYGPHRCAPAPGRDSRGVP